MLTTVYYFLQVVFCSAVLMGYYWLVLRDKKFHQYNRFYLLGALLMSWVIPLIKIQWTKPVATNVQVFNFISVVADNNAEIDANLAKTNYQFTWEGLAVAFYFLVAALMFGLIVVGLIRLFILLKKHSCKNVGDVYLILTQVKGTPFSFFRYIFWHEAIDLRSDAGKKMLEHELTHVQQKHSIDKLLIQMVLVVGWFNPFFWLLKKEMEMIHEFIADNKSVQNGDSATLAQLLLTAAYPQQQYLLTTPFFFSPIKRRLAMITNNKNPKFSYLRRIVILPLLAIVVILVAFRSKAVDASKPLSVGTLMETVADKFNNEQKTVSEPNAKNFQLSKTYTVVIDAGHGGTDRGAYSEDSKKSEAEITLAFAKAVKEANQNSNIKIILTRESDLTNTVVQRSDFANAQKADLFISLHCNDAAPIQHENGKKEASPAKGIEIYIANKEKAVNYSANAIFANELANSIKGLNHFTGIKSRIQGIWVLQAVKCPSAIVETGFMTNKEDLKLMLDPGYQKKFAEGLLDGVQSYLTSVEQNHYQTKFDTIIVRAKDSTKNKTVVIVADSVKLNENIVKPLIFIDGKVQAIADINSINPNSIEKIEVLKNESAKKVYGDAGKNGVILITLKAAAKSAMEQPVKVFENPIPKNVLYVVDGIKVDSVTAKKMDPREIATVNIWKGEKSINKFGVEPGVSVIEIISKKDAELNDAKNLTLHNSSNEGPHEKVFTVVEVPASFPGGASAWTKYLERNLKTEFLTAQQAPPGTYKVKVEFQVDEKGMVSNVHAQNDLGYKTKEEAEKLIKKGPMWVAAKQNGLNVNSKIEQTIVFVVPDKK